MSARQLRKVVVLALVFALGGPIATFAQEESRCTYLRKIECSASGCQDGSVGSAYLLMPSVDSLLAATIRAEGPSGLPTIRCSRAPVQTAGL